MPTIDDISKKLAFNIARSLDLDCEREEIIAYGAINFIHTSFSFLLIVACGIILNSLIEVLIISLTAAMLRQFSGGAHATSANRCATTSVLLFGGLSQVSKYLISFISSKQVVFLQGGVILLVMLVIYMFAPVDNPNKRITSIKMRKRLRKASFLVVMVVEILSGILWMIYIRDNTISILGFVIYLHIGLLWQSLSITFVGRFFIKSFDTLLMKMRI